MLERTEAAFRQLFGMLCLRDAVISAFYPIGMQSSVAGMRIPPHGSHRPHRTYQETKGCLMKIVAINGSHRPGKGTASLIEAALEEARAAGLETELVELSACNIEFCVGCNRCLGQKTCTINDDMTGIMDALKQADGIILGSPNYFANVSARMKNFMDRTRCLHMVENQLKGKVGGIVATTGLSNCGGEEAVAAMQRWFQIHEMLLVQPRPEGEVLGNGCLGSMFCGYGDGKVKWRRIQDDQIAYRFARQLGRDMAALIKKLA